MGIRRAKSKPASHDNGPPVRGNRRANAILGEAWPNLTGKFRPNDDRHTHSTWLNSSDIQKVLQMDRRGHAMPGMDALYKLHHSTDAQTSLVILENV